VFGQKAAIDLGLIQDREISITGTLMYQKRDYEQAIALIHGGSINLETMITHRYPFNDYQEAYQAIEALNGEFLKVMIEMPL
jgi:L-iditol 2-dehydrogenase